VESNQSNSYNTDKKPSEEEISDSDSKIKEIDTELEKKEQETNNNLLENKGKNDFRHIIKFEPEGEDEGLNNSTEEEKSNDQMSKSSEEKDVMKEMEKQDVGDLESRISENRKSIEKLEEMVASISEDMNDLIGLYEIVSGQMNPFVGLSKVTKKRLDVIENFDKEVSSLKARIDRLESNVGKIDLNEVDNDIDYASISNIDEIIDRALEQIIEIIKIEEIIDRTIEEIKMGGMPSFDIGE
jgi:flagellar protein FlaC